MKVIQYHLITNYNTSVLLCYPDVPIVCITDTTRTEQHNTTPYNYHNRAK
jgi:hypothetical protein